MSDTDDTLPPTLDSNGNELTDGDSAHVIKDLDVKGSSQRIKRGTVIEKIRLTSNPEQIECRIGKGVTVLKTCFLKKK
jgi:protein PhnA